jgi:hypothetical protein
VNDKGDVQFVKMRSGVKSLSPETEDQSFMEVNPLLILGAGSRLSKWAGTVESVTIRYDKVVMYLVKKNEKILALTMDKEAEPKDLAANTRLTRSLSKLLT